MDRAGSQFLAGTGFTFNQYRDIVPRQFGNKEKMPRANVRVPGATALK